MMFYILCLGGIIVAVELGHGASMHWFFFLNWASGKVFIYSFLIVSILSNGRAWLEWVICGFLLLSIFFNIFLSWKYKS